VAVADNVARHLKEFAPSGSMAKSKPDIAVATSSEYKLCCAVVDQFAETGHVARAGNGDLFYWTTKELPEQEDSKRWRELVRITKPIASSMVLIKAHFRVFYTMRWYQTPENMRARNLLQNKRVTSFRVIAVAGLIIGLSSLIMNVVRLLKRL
jgi:hypothetical protein